MELELIYAEMQYENARYDMEIKHLDCRKIEEELKHMKILSSLKDKKEKLLKEKFQKQHSYLPRKLITDIVYK